MASCSRSPSQEVAELGFKPWPPHPKPLPLASAQRAKGSRAVAHGSCLPDSLGPSRVGTFSKTLVWGRVQPDSQVEDCSSWLPDSVPSPTAPSPAASLPGLVLGVTCGWGGIRAGARAVKRVSGQRLMACQLAASTSTNSLSVQHKDCRGWRVGLRVGGDCDISMAGCLCSWLALRLGLGCVHTHICLCVCVWGSQAPVPFFGAGR